MMKLSEAILIGAKATKKAIGIRHTGENNPKTYATCALGAAEFAIGKPWSGDEAWSDIWYTEVTNPETGSKSCLASTIAALNNGGAWRCYRDAPVSFKPWSRTRIAKWVAKLGY